MKKRIISILLIMAMCLMAFAACGKKEEKDDVVVRVGSLKGPTSMGLVKLMKDSAAGALAGNYEFQMETQADVLIGLVSKGELDIALIPANVSSVLYNKLEGNISVIDINTLGVLYFVSGDESITSVNDLKGKTIYLTGKGTTPDYVLQYILNENGITDVTLEYKSEATEVAAVLANEENAVGFLPQPFATASTLQNDSLNVLFDAASLWDELQGENGSHLVTGVTIVRNDFLNEHEGAVKTFLEEHKASADFVNENPADASVYVEEYGIIEKAKVAELAIPKCNITCLTGEEMKSALSGYLQVLYNMDPSSVGGKLPADDFYYSK